MYEQQHRIQQITTRSICCCIYVYNYTCTCICRFKKIFKKVQI